MSVISQIIAQSKNFHVVILFSFLITNLHITNGKLPGLEGEVVSLDYFPAPPRSSYHHYISSRLFDTGVVSSRTITLRR